jgi:hypothetical protein
MSMVASGIALVSTPAGATAAASWAYSNVDCKAPTISLSIGGFIGAANNSGNNGGGSANVYLFRTFCGDGFMPGHIVYDQNHNPLKYAPPTYTSPAGLSAGLSSLRQQQFIDYRTDLEWAYNRVFQDFGGWTSPTTPAAGPYDDAYAPGGPQQFRGSALVRSPHRGARPDGDDGSGSCGNARLHPDVCDCSAL